MASTSDLPVWFVPMFLLGFPPGLLFLESGFNVVLDKPLAFDLDQAVQLRDAVKRSKRVFVLTHNYVGNVMVKQARELVRSGAVGDVRKVVVEYTQGWLSSAVGSMPRGRLPSRQRGP